MADNEVKYDEASKEIITTALMELLNQYPALDAGEEIAFATLADESGMAMFPVSGAVIKKEHKDIIGCVEQECLYPMYIVYRAGGLSEESRLRIKEWLDNLGKWLERQPVTINGTEYRLKEYPSLSGDRYFKNIYRSSPGCLQTVTDDRVENWAIMITAQYYNEF